MGYRYIINNRFIIHCLRRDRWDDCLGERRVGLGPGVKDWVQLTVSLDLPVRPNVDEAMVIEGCWLVMMRWQCITVILSSP